MLFDGHCNSNVFNNWLERELLPQLPAGTLIILDNAAFHKTEMTRKLVEKFNCKLLFLPPYSPHLNPIEHLWANIKRSCRTYANMAIQQVIKMFY